MRGCGARRNHRQIGPLEAELDRQIAGDHVDDRAGDEKRRDFTRTALEQRRVSLLDQGQTADTRADVDTNSGRVRQRRIQTRIPDRFDARCQSVVDERIHPADFFWRDVLRRIKTLDLAGNLTRHGGRIEAGDVGNSRAPGDDGRPVLAHIQPNGRDDTEPGDDNTTTRQGFSPAMSGGLRSQPPTQMVRAGPHELT